MVEQDKGGWWSVTPRNSWVCPRCFKESPCEDWIEMEWECEDCGSHDGRECPKCNEVLDHVWGSEEIEEISKKFLEGK